MSDTRHIGSTDLARNLGTYIHDVLAYRDTLLIENHGKPTVVILSHTEYQSLLAAKRELEWDAPLRRDREEMDPQGKSGQQSTTPG